MATPIKRKKGNSLWIKATGTKIPLIDAVWANWSGRWAVFNDLGQSVLSGNLVKDATVTGVFYAHIGSTQMTTLAVGEYVVVFEVFNATVDYRQELPDRKLIVEAERLI